MFCPAFLLIVFSADWAKDCKLVNYKFKQYGIQQYGSGCKKGCFGYANQTLAELANDNITQGGKRAEADHYKQDQCVDCSTVDSSFILAYFREHYSGVFGMEYSVLINETEMEKACNGGDSYVEVTIPGMGMDPFDYPTNWHGSSKGCFWKKGKCVASSCPNMVARSKCNGNWTNGKCVKYTNSDYHIGQNTGYYPTTSFPGTFGYELFISDAESDGGACRQRLNNGTYNNVSYSESADNYRWVTCDDLDKYFHTIKRINEENYTCAKFTADHVTECNYRRKNPDRTVTEGHPYEYTKRSRKECHQLYGCLYASGEQGCSTWSVWAFALTLALLIVVVVGAIVGVLVFFLVLKK